MDSVCILVVDDDVLVATTIEHALAQIVAAIAELLNKRAP